MAAIMLVPELVEGRPRRGRAIEFPFPLVEDFPVLAFKQNEGCVVLDGKTGKSRLHLSGCQPTIEAPSQPEGASYFALRLRPLPLHGNVKRVPAGG